jgi:predicted unusual protein kinase regulating ubiquinone biosynthesis (AarF/ABC1/UbiB family)
MYHDYTTERVLVMSFENGFSLTKLRDIYKEGIDTRELARIIS